MLNEKEKKEQTEWMADFAKLHNLKTPEETIQKLIEIYKAWNKSFSTSPWSRFDNSSFIQDCYNKDCLKNKAHKCTMLIEPKECNDYKGSPK